MIGFVLADAGTDGPSYPSIKHPCTSESPRASLSYEVQTAELNYTLQQTQMLVWFYDWEWERISCVPEGFSFLS